MKKIDIYARLFDLTYPGKPVIRWKKNNGKTVFVAGGGDNGMDTMSIEGALSRFAQEVLKGKSHYQDWGWDFTGKDLCAKLPGEGTITVRYAPDSVLLGDDFHTVTLPDMTIGRWFEKVLKPIEPGKTIDRYEKRKAECLEAARGIVGEKNVPKWGDGMSDNPDLFGDGTMLVSIVLPNSGAQFGIRVPVSGRSAAYYVRRFMKRLTADRIFDNAFNPESRNHPGATKLLDEAYLDMQLIKEGLNG